jgi:cytochrome P450
MKTCIKILGSSTLIATFLNRRDMESLISTECLDMVEGTLSPFAAARVLTTEHATRRICPGRHFAMNGLWIAAAFVIAAFDISKAEGPDGKPIEPVVEYEEGIVQ